ncbi:MAG: oligopeptide transporter, OPT superfamily [uncultured bacterium]|nr:MAG: oligopeptide transporter, OPT superfamily [uncultured bacterium]HBD05690.1 hypothetical protein [Candidatus Uhrbacteria bacterium]
MNRELHWRLLLLGSLICVITAAATPYVVLKLGMSVDLAYGGMFLAAALLGRRASGHKLAIELNIIQTMINVVAGVGFMCVILAAFFYIQIVFGRDIGFNPSWWQVSLWLLVSAYLGVFMGALPRRLILDDTTLPWPTAKAVQSVAETLTDQEATSTTKSRRDVLVMSTAVASFLTFIKDGLGVITPMVGKATVSMMFGLELAAIGTGMLVPLAVGLSGLLGVWIIYTFGDSVAKLVALNGTAPQHLSWCKELVKNGEVTSFLTENCGKAAEYVTSPSHFKMVIQWMMWPATAMMITAALTSVLVPLAKNALVRRREDDKQNQQTSNADERIPTWWIVVGITVCVVLLICIQERWFQMPWYQVLLAVALQPILIISGLRVLGITGQGPVSLMANATQFVFGLIWPAHIQQNLNAAHISADPQASSESTIVSFVVARRLGGSFKTLIIAQLLMLPIGALLLPIVFNMLERTYGIGLDPGQLSAPTGLKIASLAIVMEQGISALPQGALTASIIAAIFGIVVELLFMVYKHDASGNKTKRFWWIPIPAALGFALILPPILTLGIAFGSVISAVWRRFSQDKSGSYEMFGAPLAAGFIAGEALVGAILLPVLGVILELFKPYL